MNIRPTPSGSFANNIYFDEGEIDALMEEHYLGFWNGECDFEKPALDMNKFAGEYLAAKRIEFDPEAPTEDFTSNVLGKTIFNRDGSRVILINKILRENIKKSGWIGRYNFTVAHECFHALMHGALFEFPQGQLEMGLGHAQPGVHACLNRDMIDDASRTNTKTPWQEVQANRGASALLLPKTIFSEHFVRERNSYGIDSGTGLLTRQDRFDAVVGYLAKTFGASKQAVKYRILSLGLLQDNAQMEFDEISGGDVTR